MKSISTTTNVIVIDRITEESNDHKVIINGVYTNPEWSFNPNA